MKLFKKENIFWFGLVFGPIWFVSYVNYLVTSYFVSEDIQIFWKMGTKYSLIVFMIILMEFLYKEIRNYFQN